MLTQNFGVTNKEHYGMLWYFMEWSIVVSSAAVFVCSRNAPTQDASFQLAGEARYKTKITAMESKCSSAAHVNKFPSWL